MARPAFRNATMRRELSMKRTVARDRGPSIRRHTEESGPMNFTRGLLDGVAASGVFFSGRIAGPRRFSSGMESDWRAVGRDIHNAIKKAEKESA